MFIKCELNIRVRSCSNNMFLMEHWTHNLGRSRRKNGSTSFTKEDRKRKKVLHMCSLFSFHQEWENFTKNWCLIHKNKWPCIRRQDCQTQCYIYICGSFCCLQTEALIISLTRLTCSWIHEWKLKRENPSNAMKLTMNCPRLALL